MKKLILAGVVILGSVGYALAARSTATSAAPLSEVVTAVTQTSSDAMPAGDLGIVAPISNTPSNPTPKPAPVGLYKDGTYTGSVADAYYGNIQVAAVISGGKLTNVKVLQYPNDRGQSVEINQQALPTLTHEAISAQASNVHGISGASDTSAAFVQSLHAALLKAKA